MGKISAFSDSFLDSNSIWVIDFDEEALQSFYEKFTRLENDPSLTVISIIISSYGGDITIMNAMRDIIKSSRKPVATIAMGKAMSAGITLLAAGTKGYRFASPNSSLMFHEISTLHHGKATDLEYSAVNTSQINKQIIKNFASDTNQTVKFIEDQIKSRKNTDWFLTPSEALKYGIIDHINIPRQITNGPISGLAIIKPEPNKPQKQNNTAKPKPKK